MTKEEFTHSSSDTQANLELSEIAQLTDNGFPACGTTPTPSVPTPGATRTPSVPLPCSRYRYSMSTTETRTFRSRHSRCCMGTAAVLGSLLTIGVFLGIMIHFTVIDVLWKDGNVHPKLPIPRADTALGKAVPDFLGSVKISNTDWDYNLAVSDSVEYRDLAVRVEQELDRVFLLSPLKDIYNFSLVRTFRRGSIVAVFETILTDHRSLSAEKVKSSMTQGLEHRKYIRGPDDVLEIKQVVLDADSIQIIAITTTTVYVEPTTHPLAEMEESTTLPTTVITTSTSRQTTTTPRSTITTATTTVQPSTTNKANLQSVTNKGTQPLTSTVRHTTETTWATEHFAPIDPEVSTVVSPVPSSRWTPWRGTHFTTGPYFWTPGSTPGPGNHHTTTDRSRRNFVTQNHAKEKNMKEKQSPDFSTSIPRLRKEFHGSKDRPMPGRTTSRSSTPLYHTDSWQYHAQDSDLTSWFLSSQSSDDLSTQPATTRSNKVTFENFDTDKLIDTIPGLTRVYPEKTKSSNPKDPLEPAQPTLHPPDQFLENSKSDFTDHFITEPNIPKQDHGFRTNTRQNLSGSVLPTQGEHDNGIHDTGLPTSYPVEDVQTSQDPNRPLASTVQTGNNQPDQWHTSPTFVPNQDILQNHDKSSPSTTDNSHLQGTELHQNSSSQHTGIDRKFTDTIGSFNQTIVSQHELGPDINQSTEATDNSTEEPVIPAHTASYQDALFYPGNLSLTDTEIEKDAGIMGLYPEKHPNNKAHVHTGQDKNSGVIPVTGPPEDANSKLGSKDDVTTHIDSPVSHEDSATHIDNRPHHSNGHGFAVTEYTPSWPRTTWHTARNNMDNEASQWTHENEHWPIGGPITPRASDYNFPEDPDELYDYLQRLPNNAAGASSDSEKSSHDEDALQNGVTDFSNDADSVFNGEGSISNGTDAVGSSAEAVWSTHSPEMRSGSGQETSPAVNGHFDQNVPEELINKSVQVNDTKNSIDNSLETGHATLGEDTAFKNMSRDMDFDKHDYEERVNMSGSTVNATKDMIQSQSSVSSHELILDTTTVDNFNTTFTSATSNYTTPLSKNFEKVSSSSIQPRKDDSSNKNEDPLFSVAISPSQTVVTTEASNSTRLQRPVPSPAGYKAQLKQNHKIRDDANNISSNSSSILVFKQLNSSSISIHPIRPTEEIFSTASTPVLLKSSSAKEISKKVSGIQLTSIRSISTLTFSQEPFSTVHGLMEIRVTPVVDSMSTAHISGSEYPDMSSVSVNVPPLSTLAPTLRNTSSNQDSQHNDDNILKGKDNTIMQNDYYYKETKSKNKKSKQVSHEIIKDNTLAKMKDQQNTSLDLLGSSVDSEHSTQATQTYDHKHQSTVKDLSLSSTVSYEYNETSFSSKDVIKSSSTVTFPGLTSTNKMGDSSSTQDLHDLPVTSPDLASTTSISKSNYLTTTAYTDVSIEVHRSATDFIDATSVDALMESSVYPTVPQMVAKEKERELSNPYPAASGDNGGKPSVPINACLDITIMTQFIPGCLTFFSQIMHTDDILEGCQHFLAGVMCVTDEFYKHSGQQCTESQVNAFIKQHARLFNNALPNFDPLQCVI